MRQTGSREYGCNYQIARRETEKRGNCAHRTDIDILGPPSQKKLKIQALNKIKFWYSTIKIDLLPNIMVIKDFNHKDAEERWWLRGWRQLRRVKRVVLADAGEGRGGRQKERAPVDPAHHKGKHTRAARRRPQHLWRRLVLVRQFCQKATSYEWLISEWERQKLIWVSHSSSLFSSLLVINNSDKSRPMLLLRPPHHRCLFRSDHYQTKGESIYQIEMPLHLPIFWTRHLVENCQTGVSWKLIDCIQSQAGIRSKYLQDL